MANSAFSSVIDTYGDRSNISWQIEDASSSVVIDPRGKDAADFAGVLSNPGGRHDLEKLREAIGV